MADNNTPQGEGADFSKFFDKNKPADSHGLPQQFQEIKSPYEITQRVKTLLIILVFLVAALVAVLFLFVRKTKPGIPAGYHFVTPAGQPGHIESDSKPSNEQE